MLAYNFRKYNLGKPDPVREILAKIDAKQSKTGLSLYNQGHSSSTHTLPGDSPNTEEKPIFPDLKVARKKAHNRITTDTNRFESNQQHTRSKKFPHRLPSNKVESQSLNQTFPPTTFSHGIHKFDERMQQTRTIPDQQFDKEKVDININPFGYNRKTLAYETRNINYVVEWPETWPFKITSFQRKKKPPLKDIKRPSQPKDTNQTQIPLDEEDEQVIPYQDVPLNSRARVLAPIDHPAKQQSFSSKPFVESSAIKRGVKKSISKAEGRQLILRSRGNDLEFSRKDEDALKRESKLSPRTEFEKQLKNDYSSAESLTDDLITQSLSFSPNAKSINPEISRERVDSVPPSTPVPPAPIDLDPSKDVPEISGDRDDSDVPPSTPVVKEQDSPKVSSHEETTEDVLRSLLNDIVNQIIEESVPQTL